MSKNERDMPQAVSSHGVSRGDFSFLFCAFARRIYSTTFQDFCPTRKPSANKHE
jgi:hypothetical protein